MNKILSLITIFLASNFCQNIIAEPDPIKIPVFSAQDILQQVEAQEEEEFTDEVHLEVAMDELQYVLKKGGDPSQMLEFEAFRESLIKRRDNSKGDRSYAQTVLANILVFATISTIVIAPFVCLTTCLASLKVLSKKVKID